MILIGNVSICLVRERYENKWGSKNLINTAKMKYLAFIEDSISGKKREKTKQEKLNQSNLFPKIHTVQHFHGLTIGCWINFVKYKRTEITQNVLYDHEWIKLEVNHQHTHIKYTHANTHTHGCMHGDSKLYK